MRTRSIVFGGLLLLGLITVSPLWAEDEDEPVYKAPEGQAPPVAPPLRKGSPLDHLANDPKVQALLIGYKEGNTRGDKFFMAHRLIDADGGQGWGWVKEPEQRWGDARWIALQETPGLAVAPHRHLLKAELDANWEFKFWGKFASYKAYDPRLDEQLPVFVLQGYEVVGPAEPLKVKVGAPGRIQHRPSGASSRNGRPILSDPGVD